MELQITNRNDGNGGQKMSGPALKKLDSHALIHEAALTEAEELTSLFSRLLLEEETVKAKEVALIIVEHWETRTLKHAEAEEKGLYKEVVENNPDLKEVVIQLTRDHDLLRLLVKEIKELLANNKVDMEILQRFHALLLVDKYHNEEEENVILEH